MYCGDLFIDRHCVHAMSERDCLQCDRCQNILSSLPCWFLSSSMSSANCSACLSSSNCQVGSFASTRAYSPVVQLVNQTKVDENGHIIQPGASTVSGWAYIGPMLGFVVVSTIILVPLRRRVRRPVSAISVILRTPFSFLRIVPSSWTVVEIPSFYRGLVSLWVIVGLVLVTAYQSEVFVNNGVITDSSVQPGSTFTNIQSTSTANAAVSFSLVLYQTPISCDPSEFTL